MQDDPPHPVLIRRRRRRPALALATATIATAGTTSSRSTTTTTSTTPSTPAATPVPTSTPGAYPTAQHTIRPIFPYAAGPYPQQAALMDALLEGIPRRQYSSPPPPTTTTRTRTRILALESPTGTGKSLSLACAGLAWLQYEEAWYYHQPPPPQQQQQQPNNTKPKKEDPTSKTKNQSETKNTRNDDTASHSVTKTKEATPGSTGIDWLDSWQPASSSSLSSTAASCVSDHDRRQQKLKSLQQRDQERHATMVETLQQLRTQLRPASSRSSTTRRTATTRWTNKKTETHDSDETAEDTTERQQQRKENMLRMALTKARMDERKQLRKKNKQRRMHYTNNNNNSGSSIVLRYEHEDEDTDTAASINSSDEEESSAYHHTDTSYAKGMSKRNKKKKKKKKKLRPGTAEWLLERANTATKLLASGQCQRDAEEKPYHTPHPQQEHEDDDNEEEAEWRGLPPQIVYAARTHSQLSQFIHEIRKIPQWGQQVRVVALGSRGAQGLCGELTHTTNMKTTNTNTTTNTQKKKQYSEQQLTETCLELRKNHLQDDPAATVLTNRKSGSTESKKRNRNKTTNNNCCSHYVSEESVALLALHALVETSDMEDMARLGHGTKTCAYYATRKMVPVAQLIVVPYTLLCSAHSRTAIGLHLHRNTLVIVDEAHNLPDAIANLNSVTLTYASTLAAQAQLANYLQRYLEQLSSQHLRLLGQLKLLLRGFLHSMMQTKTTKSGMTNSKNKTNDTTSTTTTDASKGQQQQERYIVSSSEFLVSQRLETINVFPILRYMEETKLSQKLLGFLTKNTANKKKQPMTSFNEKEENNNNKSQATVTKKNNSNSSTATATATAATTDSSSPVLSSHISPMSIVETFLEKLTYANNDDGQVVVDKGIKNVSANVEYHPHQQCYEKEPSLRFCVLNPAVHAHDELWTKPRAVALVGGTLQPLDVMMKELIPGTIADHATIAQSMWRKKRMTQTQQTISTTMARKTYVRTTSSALHQQEQQKPTSLQPQRVEKVTAIITPPSKNNIVIRNPYLKKNIQKRSIPRGTARKSVVAPMAKENDIENRIQTAATTRTMTKPIASGNKGDQHRHENANNNPHTNNGDHFRLYRSDKFWAFTCGHVVDPSRVLLQSLTAVGGTTIDVRHKTRSSLAVTTAIGQAILRLCQCVPHGVVVFLPSYKYESILVEAWKKKNVSSKTNAATNSIWNLLEDVTTLIREPKHASQVESTLARYSKFATKSSRGACLLSVVGGKLSEGINFADDLCRCVVVVGLPYADRSDPLLQEKLKLIANSSSSSSNNSTIGTVPTAAVAAQNYYRSLCLRAVNQSVGRAIRHANDRATIILMDTRYPTDDNIARGLPSWLVESTPSWRNVSGELSSVIRRTEDFFRTAL